MRAYVEEVYPNYVGLTPKRYPLRSASIAVHKDRMMLSEAWEYDFH